MSDFRQQQQQPQQLLQVVERVREINSVFSVAQLERALQIFRSWVNVDGVEGGFALTPDELDCVLGFPDDQRGVALLVDVFDTHPQQQKRRLDLVTLLVAITLLARGTLEEKAKFIFALVDLDTEDDIVEEELALVVSACSNGLQRLGVHSESLLETDALALAYEAFEFVGVEDGEKMSFACFLRWCVFHERPRALFERISYLFSLSDTIAMLRQALHQQAQQTSTDDIEQPRIVETAQSTAQQIEADTPDAEQDQPRLWQKTAARRCPLPPATFANAWSLYPAELDRLLQLIFRKKQQDTAFNATIVCSGSHASRTTIRDTKTKLEVEQIVIGPLSAVASASSTSAPEPPATSPSALPSSEGELLDARYSYSHEFPANEHECQQYCVLELVAHPRGSTSSAHFLLQHQPNARLTVGPVVGRVTPRSVRILVELDRSVEKCVCVLTDTTTSQRFATELSVEACSPTVFKMEALRPGSRYAISFEGILATESSELGYVHTPPLILLASEWVVVHHNVMANFVSDRLRTAGDTRSSSSPPSTTADRSHWSRIVQSGMRSYSAVTSAATCAANGDTLGDHTDVSSASYNPWFCVEEAFLSEPMKNPHLVVHLGGQVDMSRAFSDAELLALDVYRLTWGVPPVKGMLRYACNLMMLNEEVDLFFSKERLKAVVERARHNGSDDPVSPPAPSAEYADAAIESAASLLRATAFEFWQRYQNQLWVDVNERDIVPNAVKNSTKFAFSMTLGICRLVFMNLAHEAHELRSTQTLQQQQVKKKPRAHAAPDSMPTAKDDDPAPINLFTNATWKTLEDALMAASATSSAAATAKSAVPPVIQQLVVVIPADFVSWAKLFPQLRPDMVRVFDKCFAWKAESRRQRSVVVICSSDRGSSLSYEVTDEKLGETLSLSTVGSISEPREVSKSTKATPASAKKMPASAKVVKGHFSKRFTYQSLALDAQEKHTRKQPSVIVEQVVGSVKNTEIVRRTDSVLPPSTASRTFASYQFLSDFRSGFLNESLHHFPPRAAPKATLGPVLGRVFFPSRTSRVDVHDASSSLVRADEDEDDPTETARATALVLLEINADARVACVVTDSLANEEIRVVQELARDRPHVFCIPGLLPERRYVYRFEGIYNASSRRGCFHTPSVSARAMNIVAVSSNFPEQMDPALDSLWAALLERVRVPWCGIDALIHVGGQVMLHEAAVQCFQWLRRELRTRRWAAGQGDDERASVEAKLRRKVRKRFQQHYHLAWNLPHVHEILASVSNWFLPSQADVAPFLRNQLPLHTAAARIVLQVAQEVVAEYQLALMFHPSSTDAEAAEAQPSLSATPATDAASSSGADKVGAPQQRVPSQLLPASEPSNTSAGDFASTPTPSAVSATAEDPTHANARSQDPPQQPSPPAEPSKHPPFVQTGDLGFFFCDLRAVTADDIAAKITCNGRLPKPLTAQEHPMVSEAQWLQLESALKRKKVLLFVLCMELPLVLTSAEYVNRIRDEATVSQPTRSGEEHEVDGGTWELYDHKQLAQHWVACKRQLEQLLGLLFRWKTKRRGRDVLVLSGGVKVGLDTLIQETTRGEDADRVLSLRCLTCGPVTASVEPFEFPLSGVACPTFAGGAKDDRFAFAHRLVPKNNYLLAQLAVVPDPSASSSSNGDGDDRKHQEALSATVEAEFVFHGEPPDQRRELDARHPVDKFRRFPSWWPQYVPMGRAVFWDDSVLLKSESDADMLELRQYVYADRGFAAAVEVFYEKHRFAETARMAELRSASHSAQRFDLEQSWRAVFADLWKAIPEARRQRVACFLDPFVLEFLLAHVAPTLLGGETQRTPSEAAIELAFFRALCQDVVFSACVLHLAVRTQRDDAAAARERVRREQHERVARDALEKARREAVQAEEKTRLELLLRSDPAQYATEALARESALRDEREARKRQKLEQKRAERLRELEEERAVAAEQKKLDRLAETDPREYARRQQLLETRVRKLQEAKAQRAAEKARRQRQQQREEDAQ